ncbi:unnamed protein product [Miscanthus lutarioriparius]|uniref:BTB domain-containing protein n=1 Tax=Miscanthus lutarioriparius TaxID=422564 RepID=A0A811R2I2_9POAL|nr:unnamed protein product [Miscanthus lutarioriparius]
MGSWCSKENTPGGRQPHDHNSSAASKGGKNRYANFGDDYHTLEQVTNALAHAGLESSNLIVGIDFTKSNEWTGKVSFNNRSLHAMGNTPNPYEQAISIIGRTLAQFDEDNLIPCFGFGDSPTSFAPIIETAIGIVDSSGGQYHVLLIIADGQVTRSVETGNGQLSRQERETIDAIVKASDYPLSIVLVGVGDGPWDMMRQFDDNIPSRAFDNFQFVNFTQIMSRPIPASKKEAEFALSALMEIPEQFKAALSLQLLGKRRGFPNRPVLPPPGNGGLKYSGWSAVKPTESTSYGSAPEKPSAPRQDSDIGDPQTCPICWSQTKDLALGCGHQTCSDCAKDLKGGEPASIWASRQIKQCSDSTALSSLARMLHEDILTDITINAADGSVRAHRAILATRSPVFRSMFSHDLREKELSTVDISDMTLDACRAFLSYIYGDVRGEEFLANRLALLRAADKYDIDDLREACHESLLEDIDTGNVLERLQTAHLYRLPRLKGGCLRFLVDFRKVYEMHDDLNAFQQTADRDLVAEVFHGVLAAWSGR